MSASRLKFKGEKHKKKRKRDTDDDGRPSSSKRREEDRDPTEWVLPEAPNELRGPTFIIHPSDPTPVSVNFNSTTTRIAVSALDKYRPEGDDEAPAVDVPLLERTPTDVGQVWVTTRVAGSSTINLRSGTGEGKFLSCDAHGIVTADRDARGPQEEWTPVVFPDGMVAFMNVYEKYLGIDEVAGGALTLRGDSEEVGFKERFWVKIQFKYKKEANDEERQKKDGLAAGTKIDEAGANKTFQTWGAGRSVVSQADKKELKRAQKEGRLGEAMLERRAKLKSDRFC
ncbi:hypothetical protein CYLTODRAFT_368209 [Cylindrobasidium torrendii FP15055 ss-10]|uniref:Actin-crosslinking protein n=1 Tax=Cylindrobasidium torrendii FP15055 ss-10 TaxID=1314674 RepID=A0A0D7BPG1_9AGAR|nr:hypothetical protein CYLTODRAFT_368209 [Cylindrobasidium torrendii FP15055 ss-10]